MNAKDEIIQSLKVNKPTLIQAGVKNIGLFGSYVRNEQNEKSDIDLLVDFKEKEETFDNLMLLYEIVEKLFEGKKVEIVTKNGLSPHIGPAILNEVVYV